MEENKGIAVVDEDRLTAYKNKKRIAGYRKAAVGMIFFFMITGLIIAYWNRSFNSYKELTSVPSSEGTETQFALYGDGYLKYSKDGISYINTQEELIWTEAYTMEAPSISVKGEYAVLADLDGNDVHLYNNTGKLGDYSMSFPIKKVMAAEQGVFCVILDGGDANYIRLYNRKGEILAEIKTQIENNGYPMAVAISSDGMKLAASFYRVEGIDSQNVLSFYNFGEGGKGLSGNLVGTYSFDDMLIPKVEFMDDNTVCAVGDSKTILYEMKTKPKKIHEIDFDTEILSVFSNEKYIGYICPNSEEEIASGKKKAYETYIYNKRGRLVKSFDKDELHENVSIFGRVIVSYSASTCVMEKMDGKEIFRQDMGENIIDVLPTNHMRDFMFVYGDRSSKIRLINELEKEWNGSEEEIEVITEEDTIKESAE